jgi:hypothetical protein
MDRKFWSAVVLPPPFRLQQRAYESDATQQETHFYPPVQRIDEVDDHHWHNEKMKRRQKLPVIRQILFSHGNTSSDAPDCSKALRWQRLRWNAFPLLSVNFVTSVDSVLNSFPPGLLRKLNGRKITAGDGKCQKQPGQEKLSRTASAAW